jgi:hypothetical protein
MMKYPRKDTKSLRLEPDIAGRIEFYKFLFQTKNRSDTMRLIMSLAQERIMELDLEQIKANCHPNTTPIHSHSLTNCAKKAKMIETEEVEALI